MYVCIPIFHTVSMMGLEAMTTSGTRLDRDTSKGHISQSDGSHPLAKSRTIKTQNI